MMMMMMIVMRVLVLLIRRGQTNAENQWCSACKHHTFSLRASHEHGCLECTCMGITDDCTSASFSSVTSPPPVTAYQQPLQVLDESSQPSGLVASVVQAGSMVEVVVPAGRSVYWRDPSLVVGSNQLNLYGATIQFVVQWESSAGGDITSSMLSSTNAVVIGRHDTALRLRVSVQSPVVDSAATLSVELSTENVVAVNGSDLQPASRKLLLLTLYEAKFLLLPASFDAQSHVSRLVDVPVNVIAVFTLSFAARRRRRELY